MIRVTADIFSGRPNPVWVIDQQQAQPALKALAGGASLSAAADSGFQGLGNRGLIVELLEDHLASEHGLPHTFRVGGGGDSHETEIAERLLGSLSASTLAHPAAAAQEAAPFDDQLKKYILETLPGRHGAVSTHATSSQTQAAPQETAASATCQFESDHFNPGYWNDPAHITKNNCYAYASNRRTDTFPQPGRASGHMYSKVDCAQVTKGAVSDGATQSCAPDAQKPRWYMALVIAPGPGFIDYHWYRKSTEGFWGHKPGGTAARNTDNSGHVVTDPRTANRGPYTIFCGFMYAQKKMVIR